jgi:hypothetical protein
MKKEVLLVLFFFIAFNSYSQKNEVYILGKDTVSKKHYLEVSNSKSTKFYKSIKYKDSKTISSRLVKRYRIGYLSFQQFVFIKRNIEKYIGKKINDSLPMVISYFHEFDSKSKKVKDFKKIKKWVDESEKMPDFKKLRVNYFKIYDKNSFITNHHKIIEKSDWINDKKSIFKQLFFPYTFEYSSFLIILPNGEYGIYYGSYPFDFIINKLKYWNYFDEYLKRGIYIDQKWFSLIN